MNRYTQPKYMPQSEHSFADQEEQIIIISNKQKVFPPTTDSQFVYSQQISHHHLKNKALMTILILTILLLAFGWTYLRQTAIIIEIEAQSIPESVINDKIQNSKDNKYKDSNSETKETHIPEDRIDVPPTQKQEIEIDAEQQRKEPTQKEENPKQLKPQVNQTSLKQVKEENAEIPVNQSISQKLIQQKGLEMYHPWDLSKEAKEALLNKYKSMPEKNATASELMPIVQNREKEILPYLQEFQKTSQVVNYSQLKMTEKERKQYFVFYNLKLALRLEKMKKKLAQQRSFTTNPKELYSKEQYKITRKQWYDAFQYHSLVGVNVSTDSNTKRIAQKQLETFEAKYNIGNYQKELKMCIISPGVNNQALQRYLWHVESVLQQNYSNYRLIIIDDMSTDKTVELLAKHLKWRNVSQDKVTLIKNKKSQKALANIFYATHKYCNFGEVQILLDSDDEFVGRQVLKVLNAVYQKQKYLTLYSTLMYAYGNPKNPSHNIGISRDHLKQDVQNNIFRKSKHRGYSSLRTMLSDVFLLTNPQSLQDRNGKFYWIVYDNAYYYSALELSCGKIHYLPEIFYYYNSNTGLNDYTNRAKNKTEYTRVVKHIDQQKNYRCLASEFMEIANYDL